MNTSMKTQEDNVTKKIVALHLSDVTILGQELGKGAYATVYTVKYRGNICAAKEIHEILQSGAQSASERRTLENNFIREYEQCANLSHPNIVRVIGIYYKSQQSLPLIIMEMMDESLTGYIERLPKDAVKRKGPILLNVAEGLQYLHSQKPRPIVHRDLSPNNILLVKNDQEITIAKIGDLGVARAIGPNSKHMQEIAKLTKVPGTKDFMPPEAFENVPEYDSSLDVFSYGGVILFMSSHTWPTLAAPTKYDPDSDKLVALTEVHRRQVYLDEMEGDMKELKQLVEKCLNDNPKKRPTMLQVCEELKSLKSKGILFMMPVLDSKEVQKQHSCKDLASSMSSGGGKMNKAKLVADHSEHTKPHPPTTSAGVPNERYTSVGQHSLGSQPSGDCDNEDGIMMHSSGYSLCMCVFDGHDGPDAVKFVKKYMKQQIFGKPAWDDVIKSNKPEKIEAALADYFDKSDMMFFRSIEPFTSERRKLQSKIPKELNKDQAQQKFPAQVARLQELESRISGGCTAVVAVLTNDRLYVANVGDSRAILAYAGKDGSLQVKQLTEDHNVNNEQELKRLVALGLDQEQLKKSGRLGTWENTRSIGDYILKRGYKDIDLLCHATKQPGSAEPHVISVTIDHHKFKYIILMSYEVYKTLEAINGGDSKKSGNKLLVEMIDNHITDKGWNHEIAINILEEIRQNQRDLYQILASKDASSPTAIANRKRDGMTLVIYKFDSAV